MRSPNRRRPLPRTIRPPHPVTDMGLVARGSSYVGSPKHKDTDSFAGKPAPRADASLCDRSFVDRQEEITGHLREAIQKGVVGHPWEELKPRYVWGVIDGVVYEARVVNQSQGHYKGYPLRPDEWPDGIQGYYDGL